MTLSIVDFLRERIEEDLGLAQSAIDDLYGPDDCYFDTSNRHIADHYLRHDPAHVLREIAAKRRIMERHSRDDSFLKDADYCRGCPPDSIGFPEIELNDCPELRDLAAIYSDHPDYREEWAT